MKERVKTMLDWETFGESAEKGGFDYFAKPGDLVDEEIYNHFLNVLPPHLMGKRGYLQAGEMHSIAYNPYEKREEGTYLTFKAIGDGTYRYLGACFTGGEWDAEILSPDSIREFLESTYRVNPLTDEQEVRPRIVCKDGFRMSVQAGPGWFCSPRKNKLHFETVEIGFPSGKEDLLMPYAQDWKRPRKTVYERVPVEVAEDVFQKHGGAA